MHRFLTRRGKFPAPPELPAIEAYLQDFRATIRNEFREKTYLPLKARPVPTQVVAEQDDHDPFVHPVHHCIREVVGLAHGGDSASATIAAVNRRNRVVRDLLRTLDQATEPLVLLGDPGSGKTMTLQQAALVLAEQESRRVFPRVPVYVRLGDFRVEGRVTPDDVYDYVYAQASPLIRPHLHNLAAAGRLVVFFDGMDEMSRDRYNEHTEALSLFAGRYATPWNPWEGSQVTKTVFSCRITDFSPKFIHRRLVLLPFDRLQIAEYLEKYVPRFPLEIEGRHWSLKALSRHVAGETLPLDANNPFVLWLLCLYLQKKHAWPRSRADMLQVYNEENYDRKEEEQGPNEASFPDRQETFLEWGRTAYAITLQNRGASIAVSELQADHDPARVAEFIRVGKLCGVLKESRDEHEYRVRFVHHRFQEFFAAHYIHRRRSPVNWLEKLDVPRWQETMLNVALMGGADDLVASFAAEVARLTEECQAALVQQHDENGKRKGKSAANQYLRSAVARDPSASDGLPDALETVLADRIELSSRMLKQSQSSESDLRRALMPPFTQAISLLATHGNPITQVKMLRASQNVPEIDFIDALRIPLHSPIDWVRNQALTLMAADGKGTARAVGSDLPTELGYDLANGTLLSRLPGYWKAARAAGRWQHWWCLGSALSCQAAYVLVLLMIAAGMYLGAHWFASTTIRLPARQATGWYENWLYQKLATEISARAMPPLTDAAPPAKPPPTAQVTKLEWAPFSVLGHPLSVGVFALSLLAALLIALKEGPALLWAALLMTAEAMVFLLPAMTELWQGNYGVLGLSLGVGFVLCTAGFAATGMAAMLVHTSCTAAFLAVSQPFRRTRHELRSFFQGSWNACAFDQAFGMATASAGVVVGLLALFAIFMLVIIPVFLWVLAGLAVSGRFLSDLSHLPYHPLTNLVILAAGIALLAVVARWVRRVWNGRRQPVPANAAPSESTSLLSGFRDACQEFVKLWNSGELLGCLGYLLLTGLIVGIATIGRPWLDALVKWLGNSGIVLILLRIVVIIVWGVGLVGLIATLSFVFQTLRKLFRLRWRQLGRQIHTAESWQKLMKQLNAEQQTDLMLNSDHQTLGLKPHEFLNVLREIRPLIKQEPALSTYWDLRDQLEQILKQEREG